VYLYIVIHANFHVSDSNGSLLITTSLKDEWRIHADAILLFYILQTITVTQVPYYLKLCYCTIYHILRLDGIKCMFLLEFYEIKNYAVNAVCRDKTLVLNFLKISQSVIMFKETYTYTQEGFYSYATKNRIMSACQFVC
jgi:hypothetical protein